MTDDNWMPEYRALVAFFTLMQNVDDSSAEFREAQRICAEATLEKLCAMPPATAKKNASRKSMTHL